ncbi:MAG TPA: FAD-dependent oxidoreductase [Thermomicrobiales bacterium]|nr:FAD-dependent oxidoreductase [Thermomicrobiales bacterium]
MFEVIVIGGGPAGVTAALRARELGAAVALVERGELGGACANDGCVPTRVLARTARLLRDAAQYADYGLAGAPPRVEPARVFGRVRRVVRRVHEHKQLRARLEAAGVRVFDRVGAARFAGPHTLALADAGTTLAAERFILCAGGRARRLAASTR